MLCRLRGDAPAALETAEELRAYLQERCGGLLTRLAREWWADGGPDERGTWVGRELRSQYSKKR